MAVVIIEYLAVTIPKKDTKIFIDNLEKLCRGHCKNPKNWHFKFKVEE